MVGVWVDLAAQAEAVLAKGCTLALAGATPEEGYGSFAYVQPPNGMLAEVVNDEILPMFEQWWAAGAV
jgi:hypothetical protein